MLFLFYLLVFTLPIPQHPLLAYQLGPLTIMKWLGVLCLGAAVIEMLRRGHCPAFSRNVSYGWFAAYVLVALTSSIAHDGITAVMSGPFMSALSTFSLFLMTTTMVSDLRRLRWSVLVALGAVSWGSVYVIIQWLRFHSVYANFRTWGGLAGDPNYYAVTVVLWIPSMIFWLLNERPRWEKRFCFCCLGLMLIGFIFVSSRGGFLGLSTALIFLIGRTRRRVRTLVLAALFVLPIFLIPGQSPVTRLLHPDASDEESSQSRLELWQASEQSFLENPLFGTGMERFHPWVIENGQIVHLPFHVAHNTYVDVITNLGLTGFIPFILVLFGALRRLGRVAFRMRTSIQPEQLLLRRIALGLQAGLIGYMVCAFFLSTLWQQVFWFSVCLSLSLPRIEASLSTTVDTKGPSKGVRAPWRTAQSNRSLEWGVSPPPRLGNSRDLRPRLPLRGHFRILSPRLADFWSRSRSRTASLRGSAWRRAGPYGLQGRTPAVTISG